MLTVLYTLLFHGQLQEYCTTCRKYHYIYIICSANGFSFSGANTHTLNLQLAHNITALCMFYYMLCPLNLISNVPPETNLGLRFSQPSCFRLCPLATLARDRAVLLAYGQERYNYKMANM